MRINVVITLFLPTTLTYSLAFFFAAAMTFLATVLAIALFAFLKPFTTLLRIPLVFLASLAFFLALILSASFLTIIFAACFLASTVKVMRTMQSSMRIFNFIMFPSLPLLLYPNYSLYEAD
eukprot:TRINITY_DN6394_c0_g1_i3.p1 TRINITY_DN6394_c0_g1~~TRINITY_DN6394_c0_g1_i3.p1  ORF type:complete len:121 (-),score=2.98 TRINITY_DN6394_c0_g1_i3:150-512(-)